MEDITNLLSDSQKRLLDLVKRRGELTVEEAVGLVDLAETTIRQHFTRLDDEGLVVSESRPEGRGRPRQYFRLSAAARQLYPSGDGEMLEHLLSFLSQEGYHRAIDDFFEEFWEIRRRRLQARLDDAEIDGFDDKLEILRSFLSDQGFMPEVDVLEDGKVVIRECNCPLRPAVEATKLPCRLEAEFLERVVGQTLTRVEYMPDGRPVCAYEFVRD